MKSVVSRSARATHELAARVLADLGGRGAIALSGPLGAGKTEFVKGLAKAAGITRAVQSPTFVLHKTYPFRFQGEHRTLHHLDLYRLHSAAEAEAIGLPELLADPDALVVVEWPEKIASLLPPHTLFVNFSYGATPERRKIRIRR